MNENRPSLLRCPSSGLHRPESIGEPSGDELAAILATGLPKRGVEVGKPEAGDIAYYLECRANGSFIELMIGAEMLDEANDDRWYIQPREKRKSLFTSKVPDQDFRELLLAVNDVLHDCERISDIRWYPFFKTPEYLALMPTSRGPIPEPGYFDAMHPLIRFDWRLKQATSSLMSPMGVVGFLVLACVLPLAIHNWAYTL